MKKTTINVAFDEEKTAATKLYMNKKDEKHCDFPSWSYLNKRKDNIAFSYKSL